MPSIEREIEKVVERALRESRLSGGAPIGILDGIEAFLAAINWTEPFILTILTCHALFFILAIVGRKRMTVQVGLLIVARQKLRRARMNDQSRPRICC